MTSSYHSSAKLVKKSRPTQTSLTKDACHESPDTENPGLVNFQVGGRHDLLINQAVFGVYFTSNASTLHHDTILERITHLKFYFMLKLNRLSVMHHSYMFPLVKAYILHPRCCLGLAARAAR